MNEPLHFVHQKQQAKKKLEQVRKREKERKETKKK